MKSLAGARPHSFEEAVLGTEIRVFGNVAAARAGRAITETV
jgi:hypothetical protein